MFLFTMQRHLLSTLGQFNMEECSDEVEIAPISPLTETNPGRTRRRKSSVNSESTTSRRPRSSRLRQVAIGNQLERWDAMKTRLGLESHAQLAEVLLDGQGFVQSTFSIVSLRLGQSSVLCTNQSSEKLTRSLEQIVDETIENSEAKVFSKKIVLS